MRYYVGEAGLPAYGCGQQSRWVVVGGVISQLELHLQICPQQLVVRTPLNSRLSTFGKPAALILPTGSWGHFLAKQPTTEGGRYSFLYAGGKCDN